MRSAPGPDRTDGLRFRKAQVNRSLTLAFVVFATAGGLVGCEDENRSGFKSDPNPRTTPEVAASGVDPRARKAAELMLREVQFEGGADPFFVSWQGCSKNDSLVYKASGLNASGERVKIVVCCGWALRGCTVRVP